MRYLLIFLSFIPSLLLAFDNWNAGAKNMALGNSTVAALNNTYAIFINPAGIEQNTKLYFDSSIRDYFGIREIKKITFLISFSIYNRTYSLSFDTFGNNYYQENRILFGSSFTIINSLFIGFKISYNWIRIFKYGKNSSYLLSLGILYRINEKICIGVSLPDVYHFDPRKIAENTKSNFSIGFNYFPLSNVSLFTTISREFQYPIDYKFGLEYNFIDYIVIRIGYEDCIDTISFGFGSEINFIRFSYAFRWHSWLGSSHGISLGFEI